MARPAPTTFHPLPRISEEKAPQLLNLGDVAVRKPSFVKLAPPALSDTELDELQPAPVRSRTDPVEHRQESQINWTSSASSSRSSSTSRSIQSSIFTTDHSRSTSGSTLLTEIENAFTPARKLSIPSLQVHGKTFNTTEAISRPYTWPKASPSTHIESQSSHDRTRLKRSPALRQTARAKVGFFALPYPLQITPKSNNAIALTASALESLAPALVKWRLLTFYSDFLPAVSHQRLADDAKYTLHSITERLRKVDWLAFAHDLESQPQKRISAFYALLIDYMSCIRPSRSNANNPNHDPDTRARNIILEAAHQLCIAPDITPKDQAANANMLSSTISTTITAYALLMQPEQRNASVLHLAETHSWSKLGRTILEDTSFIALCREHRASVNPPEYIKGVLPLLPTITVALGAAQRKYFKELRYEHRPCKCGCLVGAEERGVDGRKKDRIRYKLADDLEGDLGGEGSLMGAMRAQAKGKERE